MLAPSGALANHLADTVIAMAGSTTVPTPESAAETATDGGTAATSILTLHPSIIQTHILTRLDVSALASVATTCSQLHAIVSQEDFWANLCHSTWPSTSSPRIRHVIRRFPHGSRSFFADSATIPRPNTTIPRNSHVNLDRTPQLISAVDLYHRRQLLLSRVVQTETVSDSFRCSPFRVDILEPEEVVQAHIRYPESDEAYREPVRGLRMSWILIDASGGRAMTVSSRTPIGLQQYWQRGTAEFWFMSVMTSNEEPLSKLTVCRLTVRCVEAVGGETEVREVSLEMEEMSGITKLNGSESLVILQRLLEGKRENKKQARERCERKDLETRRRRERLDMIRKSLAMLSFVGLLYVFVVRRPGALVGMMRKVQNKK